MEKLDKTNFESLIKISRLENKFTLLFELSPVGMAMIDYETGSFLEVNPSFLNSILYEKEEITKLNFWQLAPKKYQEQTIQEIKDLDISGKFEDNEKEYYKKDESTYPIKLSAYLFTETNNKKVIWAIIEDLSAKKKYEQTVEFISIHDTLTKLPNKKFLKQRLNVDFAYTQRQKNSLAILLLDLDKFKAINNTYGTTIGDKLLIEVANRLRSTITRKTDTITRFEKDQFIIILPNEKNKDAFSIVAKKILEAIDIPFIIDEIRIKMTVSIGIALYPQNADDENNLIKKAKEALLEAKVHRNSYYICD